MLTNCQLAYEALKDKREWKTIIAENGWDGFRQAVKDGTLPRPNIFPITQGNQITRGCRS